MIKFRNAFNILVSVFVFSIFCLNAVLIQASASFVMSEEYQKEDGITIKDSTSTSVASGGDYEKTAPKIPNYVAVDIKADGQSLGGYTTAVAEKVAGNHTIIFIYADDKNNNGIRDDKEDYKVTEKFQKEDGTPLDEDKVTSVEWNDSFEATAPKITNYVAVDSKFNGTLKGGTSLNITSITQNVEVIYIYKDDANNDGVPDDDPGYFITEKYQKEDGSQVLASTTTNVVKNGSYTKKAPSVPNYTPIAVKIDGTLNTGDTVTNSSIAGNHEVIFIYTDDKNNNGIPDKDEDNSTNNVTNATKNTTGAINTTTINTTSAINTTHAINTTSIINTTNTTTVNTTSVINTTNATTVNTTSAINTTNTTMNISNITNISNVSFNSTLATNDTTNHGINTTGIFNTTSNEETIGEVPILEVPDYKIVDLGTQVDTRGLIEEASDPEDGDDLNDKVVITGTINVLKVGVYPINYSLTDSNGNTTMATCFITVKGKDTVFIGDNAIDAHDFSISVNEVNTLTNEDIITRAGIKAWNTRQGIDLTDKLKIDATNIKNAIGQYKVSIRVNILPAINGKDSLGNDIAIINATVYNNAYSNTTNNINNNSSNGTGTGTGKLPTTGEKYTYFNVNIK